MSNRKIPLSPVEWGIFYFPFPLLPVLRSAFPLYGGVGGGFLIYDFLSFSAFFFFSSCIYQELKA